MARNTNFEKWWKAVNEAFQARGLREPTFSEARDAYEVGESPETFAAYVEGTDCWNEGAA